MSLVCFRQMPCEYEGFAVEATGLLPLESRALSEVRVRSLNDVRDRLERLHELKGWERKKRGGQTAAYARSRLARDRAIVRFSWAPQGRPSSMRTAGSPCGL